MSKVIIKMNDAGVRALMNESSIASYCKSLAEKRSKNGNVTVHHGKTRVNASYRRTQTSNENNENQALKDAYRKEHR